MSEDSNVNMEEGVSDENRHLKEPIKEDTDGIGAERISNENKKPQRRIWKTRLMMTM
jgi:hypothetical protein